MKALTIQQPWAGLLVLGIKKFETRTWKTAHRGKLAIHSSARITHDGKKLLEFLKQDIPHVFFEGSEAMKVCTTPGSVLGEVEVISMISSNSDYTFSNPEKLLGDFSPDRWLWRCEDPVIYIAPVPAFGKLSLWNWDKEN